MERIHLKNVDIILDGNKTAHQIGDYIHGKLRIQLNGELSLSMVKIGFVCIAKVRWDDFVYQLKLLDEAFLLPPEISRTKLERGTHEIPFKFQLPDSDIPSSFESNNGCICYWVESIIEEPAINETHKTGIEIKVEAPIKQNLYLAVGGGTEKEIGILCLGSNKVRIDATIRKKGHIPGETVEINCVVTNTSSVAVTPRASFFETQIYMAKEKQKTVEDSSEPVVGEQVNAGETREQIISVQIPKDVPLSIKSRLISIKYFVHVTLDIPYALDLHLNLPLIITNEYALNDSRALS